MLKTFSLRLLIHISTNFIVPERNNDDRKCELKAINTRADRFNE